jgi:hypothetical protein
MIAINSQPGWPPPGFFIFRRCVKIILMPRESTQAKIARLKKIIASLDWTHPEAPDGTSLFAASERN